MTYTRNQPVASDDLDVSQPFLLNNTNASDDIFGIDHYKFSDLTVNKGFHNQVTTAAYTPAGDDPAPTGYAKLYAKVITAPVGLIQYSRAPDAADPINGAVPTPITCLQSPAAGQSLTSGNRINVLDCTGITRGMFELTVWAITKVPPIGVQSAFYTSITFEGGAPGVFTFFAGGTTPVGFQLIPSFTGNILQIFNSPIPAADYSGIYWVLRFNRLQ